jgi:hypothetical protein
MNKPSFKKTYVCSVTPKPRYFVHTSGPKPLQDHVRLEGGRFFIVAEDGTETINNVFNNWGTETPEQRIQRYVSHNLWIEKFPQSSESLLRSHRYAETYEDGKARGFEDGKKVGYEDGVKEGLRRARAALTGI